MILAITLIVLILMTASTYFAFEVFRDWRILGMFYFGDLVAAIFGYLAIAMILAAFSQVM